MSKFKINTVRDSETVRKFTFRIRDMYEKYTFEATTKAKDVMEAKQKIKEKLIGWANMMIMHVEDELGNQYFGNKLYNFKDEDTTGNIQDDSFNPHEVKPLVDKYKSLSAKRDNLLKYNRGEKSREIETINQTLIDIEKQLINKGFDIKRLYDSINCAKIKDRNAYENMNDRCYSATTPQGYSIVETYVDNDNKIYIIAKRPEDYMIAEDYQVSDGTWKKSTNGFESIGMAQDELKKTIKNLTRIFDTGVDMENVARQELNQLEAEISQKEYELQSYEKYDMQHGESKSTNKVKERLKNELKDLRNKLEEKRKLWGYVEDSDFECDKDGKNCATIGAVLNGGINVADFALARQDAIDRCIALGKQFIGHFDKIYKNPISADVNHWKSEMGNWLKSVREIKLKQNNSALTNSELHDWFFTAGANAIDFMKGADRKEESAYSNFVTKLLGGATIDNALSQTVKDIMPTKETGMDKIVYVMQSDADPNLYFYIGKKYSMKEGAYSYQKYEMLGTSPEELKFDLKVHGWHQVDIGPAKVIDNKIYAPIVDAESFAAGDRVLHVAQETKGTVEKVLPNGNLYVKWDSYIKAPNGQTFTAGEEDPKITKIIKMKDAEYWKWGPAYSINIGDWIIPRVERQKQANMPDKGIHWWKVIDISQRNPQSNILSFTLQDIMNARVKVDIPEDEKVMLSKTAVHDNEPIDYNAQEAESILRRGVSAENSAIDEYEPWIMRLKELYNETGEEKYLEAAKAIEDIDNEEKKHVGEFSQALTNFSPEEGKLAVEGMDEVKAETKQEDARPLDTYIIQSYKGKKEIDAESEDDAVKKYQAMFSDVDLDEITIQKVKRIESWNHGAKLASENRDCDVKDGSRWEQLSKTYHNENITLPVIRRELKKVTKASIFREVPMSGNNYLFKMSNGDNISTKIYGGELVLQKEVHDAALTDDSVDDFCKRHNISRKELEAYAKNSNQTVQQVMKGIESDKEDFTETMQHYTYDEKPESLTAGDVVEETTEPKESKPIEKPQPIKDGFDENKLNAWLRALEAQRVKEYPDNELNHKKYRAQMGPKYIKIIEQDYTGTRDVSAFAFVDYDGNIYKPAGWNAPAKGVRATLDNPPLHGSQLYR